MVKELENILNFQPFSIERPVSQWPALAEGEDSDEEGAAEARSTLQTKMTWIFK